MRSIGDAADRGPRRRGPARGSTGPAPTRSAWSGPRCWPPARTAVSRARTRSGSVPTRGRAARARAGGRPAGRDHGHHDVPARPAGRRPAPAQRRRPDLRLGAHRRVVAAGAARPRRLASRSRSTAPSRSPPAGTCSLKGELSTGDLLDCAALGAGDRAEPRRRRAVSSSLALKAAEQWSPTVLIPRRLARVAEVAARRAEEPEHRTAALNTLAWTAVDAGALRPARRGGRRRRRPRLAGAGPARLARPVRRGRRRGRSSSATRTRRPSSARTASRPPARSRRPRPRRGSGSGGSARSRPASPVTDFARCFWRPVQHELMVPWAHRYLDEITALSSEGLLAVVRLVRRMMPTTCDEAWLDRAQRPGRRARTSTPIVRNELLDRPPTRLGPDARTPRR